MSDWGPVSEGILESMNTRFSTGSEQWHNKKLYTDQTDFDTDDIEAYIRDHQKTKVPELEMLWQYYLGRNTKILSRHQETDTPSNNTPVAYGRKIVTTFTGYAYRPRYITYKPAEDAGDQLHAELVETFNVNNEHIKTNRNGRNTAIFGVSYELLYIDGVETGSPNLPVRAEPRFVNADPRTIILLYDYSPEPEKVAGIRYWKKTKKRYQVELYLPDVIRVFERVKRDDFDDKWYYEPVGEYPNYFGEVPIVPYYLGDEALGVIRPVKDLIDDYDLLVSDSVVEFDRFANAYLRLVGQTFLDKANTKDGGFKQLVANIKRFRVFNRLSKPDDVTFLTKDIPKEFIEFMTSLIRDEIHKQSHVPDFAQMAVGGDLSGAAVRRLLFDFENVVSSAEGDFDIGLLERIRLITKIYAMSGRGVSGGPQDISISHKRNVPADIKEFAEISNMMKQAGLSRYLIADIWPDDIIPNVEEELARQDEEMQAMMPQLDELVEEPVNDTV